VPAKKPPKPASKNVEPAVDEDDSALFRNAVGEVRKVKSDTVHTTPIAPPPLRRQADADNDDVMASLLKEFDDCDALETGEHLGYARPGVQRGVLKKLRTGRYAVQAEIDLHGLTVKDARRELSAFLADVQQRHLLCVRVIHGKGRKRPEQAPRLKPAVNQWLQSHKQVLAFCSARPAEFTSCCVNQCANWIF